MDTKIITYSAIILLSVISVGYLYCRKWLGRQAPERWVQIYDVNECPYDKNGDVFSKIFNILSAEKDVVTPEDRKLVKAIISKKASKPNVDTKSRAYVPEKIRKIPRIIIQTNEDDEVPESMFIATGTFLNKNPNYDYVYFNNTRARDYIKVHYPAAVLRAYDDLIPGAYKADLFRYCILYKMGGVYVDTGMIALCSLDDFIKDGDTFLSPEDNGTSGIYNAFICCQPKNPIIGEAIRLSVDNIRRREYTNSPLGITGPLLLSKAFTNIVGKPIKENQNYGDGIRILNHFKPDKCASGEVHDGNIRLISTRSPTYRRDQKWYNKNKRYTDLWNDRQVYK